MTETNSIITLADRVIASCDASIAKCVEILATLERIEARDKERERANAKPAHQIDDNRCRICNGTGWNHGAQPGPDAGYRTVRCKCGAGSKP